MRSGHGHAAFLRRLLLPSKATPHALTPNRDSPTAAASPANIKHHLAPTDAALALLRPAREASPPTAPPLSIGGLRCRPPEVPRRRRDRDGRIQPPLVARRRRNRAQRAAWW